MLLEPNSPGWGRKPLQSAPAFLTRSGNSQPQPTLAILSHLTEKHVMLTVQRCNLTERLRANHGAVESFPHTIYLTTVLLKAQFSISFYPVHHVWLSEEKKLRNKHHHQDLHSILIEECIVFYLYSPLSMFKISTILK